MTTPQAFHVYNQIYVSGLPHGLKYKVEVPQPTHIIVYKDAETFKLEANIYYNQTDAEDDHADMLEYPGVWEDVDFSFTPQLLAIQDGSE